VRRPVLAALAPQLQARTRAPPRLSLPDGSR
jgi:hypothetical protein